MKKTTWIYLSAPMLVAAAALTACGGELPTGIDLNSGSGSGSDNPEGIIGGGSDQDDDPTNDDGNSGNGSVYSGGEENTYDHLGGLGDDYEDPFAVLEQRQEEGPPEIRARLHSCQKLQVRALRNTLAALGVNLDATANPDPAGELLAKGSDALGGANYASRTGEARTWTNSGATKIQDIFVMAAPEVIAAMPNATHCQIEGVGVEMFIDDESGSTCNEDAVSCLIGRPATAEYLAICNAAVAGASDIDKGKEIAVASLLAGAHTCE